MRSNQRSDNLDALSAAPEPHIELFENERVQVLDTRVKVGDMIPGVTPHRRPRAVTN